MKYRCFGLFITSLGNGRKLVHSRLSGTTKVLPASEAQTLLSCRSFRVLRDHARTRCQERQQAAAQEATSLRGRLLHWALKAARENDLDVPVRSKDVERVEHQLADFVEGGFLVSEADLLADLRSLCENVNGEAESPVTVASLGMATCNRPEALRRSIASYLENARHYDRPLKLIIVDDAEEKGATEATRNVLFQLQHEYDAQIFYADRQHRARFAGRLTRHADVSPEVAWFTLLGDARCGMTYGAAINALLLHTAGEATVISDDDVRCKVAAAPEATQGLTLTSKQDANEYWFFKDHDVALDAVCFADKDFFGLHEQFLGRTPLHAIASAMEEGIDLDLEEMGPRFLRNLHASEARVALSFVGMVGDSGSKDTLHRLFAESSTFERLVDARSDYQTKSNTHQILKATRQVAIDDGVYCMSTAMGLDHRTLLPPFMPVQRNCDGVFGLLLKVCFPSSYRGFVPYALVHSRSTHRVAPGVRESVKAPRVNDLLQWLILAFDAGPHAQDGAAQLRRLGRFLTAWGQVPPGDFEDFVRQVCYRNISRMLQEAERRLDKKAGRPMYWAEDMRAFISAHEELLLQSDFFVPSDLSGRTAERMAVSQDLVYKFGELLIHWPAMVEAAKELRNRGEGLGEEVQRALVNNVA